MSVEDIDKIDFVHMNARTGTFSLTITDHLDYAENQGEHLLVLQGKLNTYLEFLESGKIYAKIPEAIGRKIVIRVFGKFPLSEVAQKFYRLAGKVVEDLGYSLTFEFRPGRS
jgi:hypothetical protein